VSLSPFTLFEAWRTTRRLDEHRSGSAPREHAVVHALLTSKDEVPKEPAPQHLRRKIALRLEATAPLPGRAFWDKPAGRIALFAPVMIGLAGASAIWLNSAPPPPTRLAPVVARGPVPSPAYLIATRPGPEREPAAAPARSEVASSEPTKLDLWYSPLPTARERRSATIWEKMPLADQASAFSADARSAAEFIMSRLPAEYNTPRD